MSQREVIVTGLIHGLKKRLHAECGLPLDQATAVAVLVAISDDESLLSKPLPEFKVACVKFVLRWARKERMRWEVKEAAKHFEWSESTQIRYEGSGSAPRSSTVDIMLRDYGLSDDDLCRLATVALARRR